MGFGWPPYDPRVAYPCAPRPPLLRRLGYDKSIGAYVAVAGAAFLLTAASIWVSMSYYSSAGSYCQALEAGGRFAVFVETLVAIVVVGAISTGVSLAAARIDPWIGLGVGILIAFWVGYYFLAQTASMIRASGDPSFCPSGLPPWWPVWAPR
jgi:hypothetical protein